MSSGAVKKIRQQARRVIGGAGLDRLAEHDAALVHHASQITQTRDHLVTLVHDYGPRLAVAEQQLTALDARMDAMHRLPLWRRVRWLCLGT